MGSLLEYATGFQSGQTVLPSGLGSGSDNGGGVYLSRSIFDGGKGRRLSPSNSSLTEPRAACDGWINPDELQVRLFKDIPKPVAAPAAAADNDQFESHDIPFSVVSIPGKEEGGRVGVAVHTYLKAASAARGQAYLKGGSIDGDRFTVCRNGLELVFAVGAALQHDRPLRNWIHVHQRYRDFVMGH